MSQDCCRHCDKKEEQKRLGEVSSTHFLGEHSLVLLDPDIERDVVFLGVAAERVEQQHRLLVALNT